MPAPAEIVQPHGPADIARPDRMVSLVTQMIDLQHAFDPNASSCS